MSGELFEGYIDEDGVATQRKLKPRTLRLERQLGKGPPWVRVGRLILYPIDGFREWLRANEVQPVRAQPAAAPKPPPAPRTLRREAAPIAPRKRQREFETTS